MNYPALAGRRFPACVPTAGRFWYPALAGKSMNNKNNEKFVYFVTTQNDIVYEQLMQ